MLFIFKKIYLKTFPSLISIQINYLVNRLQSWMRWVKRCGSVIIISDCYAWGAFVQLRSVHARGSISLKMLGFNPSPTCLAKQIAKQSLELVSKNTVNDKVHRRVYCYQKVWHLRQCRTSLLVTATTELKNLWCSKMALVFI